jgi:GxxExxY protein
MENSNFEHNELEYVGEPAEEYLHPNGKLRRNDLLYPELSYKIIGIAFDVFNEIGSGHMEKYYQKAMEIGFDKIGVKYKSQFRYDLTFKGSYIGRGILDFLVEEKIVVEIKKDFAFKKINIDQVNNYLRISDKELAILINFSPKGVYSKRIVNILPKTNS